MLLYASCYGHDFPPQIAGESLPADQQARKFSEYNQAEVQSEYLVDEAFYMRFPAPGPTRTGILAGLPEAGADGSP